MKTASKQQSAKLAKAIHAQHATVCDAVHGVLQAAGLRGVTVQSIDYTVSPDTLGGPPIECPPGTIPATSNGQWFCKPL